MCDGRVKKAHCRSVLTAEMAPCCSSKKENGRNYTWRVEVGGWLCSNLPPKRCSSSISCFFLPEDDASGLPAKRSLAAGLGRTAACDVAPKRGTEAQQASGFDSMSF